MNFLNVFEQRVGSLFGATAQGLTAPFSFKKLAKKAAREMEAETYVINGVDTAPALYTILVSSEDDLSMRPLYAQITKETAQFIEGQAQGKGYSFVGRPVVRFMADPSLRSGKFSVFAENVDAQTLNRLREEEALFLGVGGSRSGGLGGAAGQRAQRPAQPQPQPMSQGLRPIPQPAPAKPSPADSMSAGLDVMPQEAVLDAEQALLARGGVRQIQNVPLAGSRQAGSPQMPPASQAPQYASATVYQQAPAAPAAVAVPAVAPVAAPVAAAAAQPQPAAQPAPQTVRVAPAVPAPAPAAPAAPATCLLIDRQSGRTYTAAAPRTIVGRERTPGGVVLHDPNVSRSHAELSHDGQGWRIRDLNSTNGTLVNDVDVDECPLRDGDLITLGLTNLEFREN